MLSVISETSCSSIKVKVCLDYSYIGLGLDLFLHHMIHPLTFQFNCFVYLLRPSIYISILNATSTATALSNIDHVGDSERRMQPARL